MDSNAPYFKPTDLSFRLNPYPIFQRLLLEDPIIFYEPLNAWFFSRHEDVKLLVQDTRFGKNYSASHPEKAPLNTNNDPFLEMQSHWLFLIDPPDHSRIRSLVNKPFTPRQLAPYRNQIEAIAEACLQRLEGQRELDFLKDFAAPFPMQVMAFLFGVELRDEHRFYHLSNILVEGVDVGASEEDAQKARDAALEFKIFFDREIAKKRQQPEDDILSRWLAYEKQGDRLSYEELVATAVLVFSSGYETSSNLIANGLLALLQNPQQLQRLRNERERIPDAVEEMLRFYSPGQVVYRMALESIEYKGYVIEAGQWVYGLAAAANHDPGCFSMPENFDICRQPNPHLTFGGGIHHCLGASLGRLMACIAFEKILDYWPSIRLNSPEIEWTRLFVSRTLKSLPICVDYRTESKPR